MQGKIRITKCVSIIVMMTHYYRGRDEEKARIEMNAGGTYFE